VTDNSFGRLVGALVSPGSTFESISKRPTWFVAWLVLVLCVTALSFSMHQRTDYREVVERSAQAFGAEIPADQLERQVEMRERFGGIGAPIGGIVAGIVFCVLALVYWVAFKLFGSEITYKQSLATFVHASLPGAVFMLLAIPVVLGGGDLTYQQLMTRDVLASNLGFLAPEGAGIAVHSLLAGIDFFALWSVVLVALGYRIVARVSTGLATGVAVVFYLLGLGLRVGMAVVFSGGAG
jgi:hypothetical protein